MVKRNFVCSLEKHTMPFRQPEVSWEEEWGEARSTVPLCTVWVHPLTQLYDSVYK